MTKTKAKPVAEIVNALFLNSPDGLREIVRAVMQEMLEAEMTNALEAEKGERSAARARLPLRPLLAHPRHPRCVRRLRAAGHRLRAMQQT